VGEQLQSLSISGNLADVTCGLRPDVPYKIERKENPAVRGIFLLVSALMLVLSYPRSDQLLTHVPDSKA
jgi:hypothetical protein